MQWRDSAIAVVMHNLPHLGASVPIFGIPLRNQRTACYNSPRIGALPVCLSAPTHYVKSEMPRRVASACPRHCVWGRPIASKFRQNARQNERIAADVAQWPWNRRKTRCCGELVGRSPPDSDCRRQRRGACFAAATYPQSAPAAFGASSPPASRRMLSPWHSVGLSCAPSPRPRRSPCLNDMPRRRLSMLRRNMPPSPKWCGAAWGSWHSLTVEISTCRNLVILQCSMPKSRQCCGNATVWRKRNMVHRSTSQFAAVQQTPWGVG